jgi:hypothetical protein
MDFFEGRLIRALTVGAIADYRAKSLGFEFGDVGWRNLATNRKRV